MTLKRLAAFLVLLPLIAPDLSSAAPQGDDPVAAGLRQLEAARTERSEQSLREAENTFTEVLARTPNNARALVHLGEARLARGGLLAGQGQYGAANEAIQSAIADMDRAVVLASDNLEVRLARGFAYGAFPPYLNKSSVAREDLETATRHPGFSALPKDQRARAFQLLGSVYANLTEASRAADAFRSAIDADAESRFGQDAKAKLASLEASGARDGAQYRPDRFPGIEATGKPLVAAASVTFPGGRSGDTPSWLTYVTKALEGFPGMLGLHTVASVDHPGMFIIFTWWKDKQALNDFYYSDVHQAWMGRRGLAITEQTQTSEPQVPTQVAVEVFEALPEGIQMNGGFVPTDIFEMMRRQNRAR